jgi:hypothetical protein
MLWLKLKKLDTPSLIQEMIYLALMLPGRYFFSPLKLSYVSFRVVITLSFPPDGPFWHSEFTETSRCCAKQQASAAAY